MQNKIKYFFIILGLVFTACRADYKIAASSLEFGQPTKVTVVGYSGNIMEPFISRDGNLLLFNNLNALPENTNLHWATKTSDSTFLYKGEITGVNTPDLEGVPTMDNAGNLYFVSLRNYNTTLSSIYQGNFLNGNTTNIQITNGISRLQAGWLNFDVEISADGETMYFADAQFNGSNIPTTADLVIAKKDVNGFKPQINSSEILKSINTNALEYAACISENQLELYFTRLIVPVAVNTPPEILVATRQSINEPFGIPVKMLSLAGFVEAPTIAPDQKTIYFHKKENDIYVLYFVKKQ